MCYYFATRGAHAIGSTSPTETSPRCVYWQRKEESRVGKNNVYSLQLLNSQTGLKATTKAGVWEVSQLRMQPEAAAKYSGFQGIDKVTISPPDASEETQWGIFTLSHTPCGALTRVTPNPTCRTTESFLFTSERRWTVSLCRLGHTRLSEAPTNGDGMEMKGKSTSQLLQTKEQHNKCNQCSSWTVASDCVSQ